MRLTLVRHAESIWNSTSQWQGQSDVPLSPRGRVQARALAKRLFGESFDRVWCSDLSRAADTASALGLELEHTERLREIDVGVWAGLAHKEVAKRFPDELHGLRAGLPVRIGGGESMPEFEGRVDALFDELRDKHAGERVLVVTHGGVIRALATRILGMRGVMSPLVGVGNTSISIVDWSEEAPRLSVYNDGAHLATADADFAFGSEPTLRAALIAADPEAPADRRLADALLSGLRIARMGLAGPSSALADHLVAEPLGEDAADALLRLSSEQDEGAFALVAVPKAVRTLCAEKLRLQEDALTIPPHGSAAQLRLSARGAVLHSYAVAVLAD